MSRLVRQTAACALILSQVACAHAVGVRPTLVTDRPDFTEATELVERGRVQLESGDTFTRDDREQSNAVGEVLLRVGLAPAAELRVAFNSLVRTRATGVPDAPWTMGREDASLGAKLRVLDKGRGLIPATSVIVATSLPTGSAAMRHAAEPEAKLLMGWELSPKWELASNLNAASLAPDGDRGRTPEASASLSLGHSFTERLGGYAEAFAFRPRGMIGTQFLNAGMTVLVSDDLQLDARAGHGVGSNARETFFGVGFARRW